MDSSSSSASLPMNMSTPSTWIGGDRHGRALQIGGATHSHWKRMAIHHKKSDPTMVKIKHSDMGMSLGIKHLYGVQENNERGRYQWQQTIPDDIGVPAEDAETETWAIVVRYVKAWNDPKKVLEMHSIVIQSPLLKELLADVLADYPNYSITLKRPVFDGRFEPLIHRWTQLTAAIANLKRDLTLQELNTDEVAALTQQIEHAELLYDVLNKEFADTIESSRDMMQNGVMSYGLLWTLFQPGDLVYNKQMNQDRVFRLLSGKYGTDQHGHSVFVLDCQYVDYDGLKFGNATLKAKIASFEGTMPITSLATLPFEYHSAKEEMRVKLIDRGAKVEKLTGRCHYVAYNGVGWRMDDHGLKAKFSVKGRIVLDAAGWNKFNPNQAIFVGPLDQKTDQVHGALSNGQSTMGHGADQSRGHELQWVLRSYVRRTFSRYDDGYDNEDGGVPMDGAFLEETELPQAKPLTDEQKLVCTPLARGYALKEKMWLNFFVNAVTPIKFNEKAFDSLVLPSNQKELILGFTSTQQEHRSQFDDVIEGKGRGIILLLCGPPGVGKTLTAESVAEEMRVPLCMMSAGDLGSDSRAVEITLNRNLQMCARWDAIVLIDEADVFLEARSLHEIERNRLVSVFLRLLEYYEGIMFLTTNRVQTFDAAFQSRIHISLEYKELDDKGRKTVWENFLRQHDIAQAAARERPPKPLATAARPTEFLALQVSSSDGAADTDQAAQEHHLLRTRPHKISSSEIGRLAQINVNGRQIKNILKTAQLLASHRGESLRFEHVQQVLDVTQHLYNANQASHETQQSLFS